MKLLSICIPNYNRIEKLEKMLKSIIADISQYNMEQEVQICISDDFSDENPEQMINQLIKTTPNIDITYGRNIKNEGMDYNFLKCVVMAESQYCWIVGNDDVPIGLGITMVLEKLKREPDIDIVVTPFESYDYNDNYIHTIYPIESVDNDSERIFDTSIKKDFDNLINSVENNAGLFGFLSNVIFKRERWIKNKEMFMDKMDTIFIQMYMNIQLLKEGAVYLYYPKIIIKNYIDFDTGKTFERGYKILVGLDGVINYFFEGEQKKKLQKTVMDVFVTSNMWEVKEGTAEWERLCQIDSEKNKLFERYYVPTYKRRETFWGKKCIIYGAGKLGKKAMTELESLHVDILGFCDADVRKQGTNINGYKIYNFNRLLQMSNDDRCVVLVECSAERMEVINKLFEYGVNDIAFI